VRNESNWKQFEKLFCGEALVEIQNRRPMGIGLIGYGAIGQVVAKAILDGHAGRADLRAILCRDAGKLRKSQDDPAEEKPILTDNPEKFFHGSFDLVIEAAGQDALRQYGNRILESGWNLLITSIGALTDDDFFEGLKKRAEKNGTRIFLISGALPAMDWLAAAALSGDCSAIITQAKPVASWRGTPAAEIVDLDNLPQLTCFFEGTARQAASRFPKSSNITAMLALATAGMDKTQVRLVADPNKSEMCTIIDFMSKVGSLRVEWTGVPSELNPKTSADVPFTVIKAIRNLTDAVCYGL
jgi:aspartate dehydrogenase